MVVVVVSVTNWQIWPQVFNIIMFFFQYWQVAGTADTPQAQTRVPADPGLPAPAVQPDVLAQQQAVHRLPLRPLSHQHHPICHEGKLLQ